MRVVVTSQLPGEAVNRLAQRFDVLQRRERSPITETELIELIGDAGAAITLLGDPVSRAVIDSCPRLRVIANYAVGFDNIDLDAARERGIWVTNTPDVLTEATADLTLALMLATTRRVLEGDALLRAGRFERWEPGLLLGRGLQSKTLGIVGLGRIGSAVAVRAAAFGMRVVYTGRSSRTDLGAAAAITPRPEHLQLEELLRQSDLVSLHCPLTSETRYLLSAERLALMRKGAYLINTSRGPLVDEAALAAALERGELGGAGLDVYENEPEVHPGLLGRPDVVLLPHIGSATHEAREAMAELAAGCVEAVLDGREPATPVVCGRL